MKIITLCGSMRFKEQFKEWEVKLTLDGNLVLSVLILPDDYEIDLKQKILLQINHFNKINISDEIFVLDIDNYIGEDTQREIEYAKSKGKIVKYLNKKIFKKGDKVKCINNQSPDGYIGLELGKLYEVNGMCLNEDFVSINQYSNYFNKTWNETHYTWRFELIY